MSRPQEMEGRGGAQGPRRRASRAIAIVALATIGWLSLTGTAQAVMMRFEFEGTVTSAGGIWSGEGSTVSGFYEYDTDALDLMVADSGHDAFAPDSPMANEARGFVMSVTVGSVTRSTASNRLPTGERHHLVQFFDRPSDDEFSFTGFRRVPTDDFAMLRFVDLPGGDDAGDPDGIADGSFNLNDTPLTDALQVALFDAASGIYHSWHDDQVCIEGTVTFDVNEVRIVPEPSTAILLGLGLVGTAGVRRRS